jgi:hypothetical protein
VFFAASSNRIGQPCQSGARSAAGLERWNVQGTAWQIPVQVRAPFPLASITSKRNVVREILGRGLLFRRTLYPIFQGF